MNANGFLEIREVLSSSLALTTGLEFYVHHSY